MNAKQDIVPNRSALANSNEGNTMTNTGYSGGKGRGHGGNRGGRGRGHGPPLWRPWLLWWTAQHRS